MPIGATFDPQGGGFRQSAAIFGEGQSLMQRADENRRAKEIHEIKMAQEQLLMPVRVAQVRADLQKAKSEYDGALITQSSRAGAYEMIPKAQEDLDFLLSIEDGDARGDMALEWLNRYSQLENIAELAPQVKAMNEVASNLIFGGMKVSAAGRMFNQLTKGLPPEDKDAARRVELGLQARPTSAAIQYQKVTGPDGVERLVAVDPREVGAQAIGTGERYGSGVERGGQPTPGMAQTPQGTQQANVFAGQTPEQKTEQERMANLRVQKPKREKALANAERVMTQMTEDIDRLISEVNAATAGPGGVILGAFPGTTARDLKSNLDSLKANVGFQTLQAMREASPTGGALGQVSDVENKLLQATLGSLEVGQSPSQLIDNLRRVKQRVIENYGIARGAFGQEFGGVDDSAPVSSPSQIRDMSTEQLEQRLNQLRAQ